MTPRTACAAVAFAAAALLVAACGFSPISHRIKVGEESFVVFVGEGVDHHTDLFAASAGGGTPAQVTFTSLIEQGPRLTPLGDVVAFLRMHDSLPETPRDVVLMNLLDGGESTLALPAAAGTPTAVAWSADASTLYIRTTQGLWRSAAPPKPSVVTAISTSDSAIADSALDLWLGQPRFARVIPCHAGGLCIIGPKGDTTALASRGHHGMRWGDDSVAWFDGDGMIVRSLGPGRERRITWQNGPTHPRDGSYAVGISPGR